MNTALGDTKYFIDFIRHVEDCSRIPPRCSNACQRVLYDNRNGNWYSKSDCHITEALIDMYNYEKPRAQNLLNYILPVKWLSEYC